MRTVDGEAAVLQQLADGEEEVIHLWIYDLRLTRAQNTKNQAPEKIQCPNPKIARRCRRIGAWNLGLLWCLELGVWCLVFGVWCLELGVFIWQTVPTRDSRLAALNVTPEETLLAVAAVAAVATCLGLP